MKMLKAILTFRKFSKKSEAITTKKSPETQFQETFLLLKYNLDYLFFKTSAIVLPISAGLATT